MSLTDAEAFIERAETDEAFAKDIESLGTNQDAVLARIREEGYDVRPDEIKEAFLERYGAELTPEQLETVAAGMSDADIAGAVTGGVIGGAMVVAICAAL